MVTYFCQLLIHLTMSTIFWGENVIYSLIICQGENFRVIHLDIFTGQNFLLVPTTANHIFTYVKWISCFSSQLFYIYILLCYSKSYLFLLSILNVFLLHHKVSSINSNQLSFFNQYRYVDDVLIFLYLSFLPLKSFYSFFLATTVHLIIHKNTFIRKTSRTTNETHWLATYEHL